MYPTLIAGLILLFSAIHYVRTPDRARLRVVKCLGVLVMLTSTLGFVTGMIKTFTSITPELGPDVGSIVVQGAGESLNNVGLGLCWLVLATIIATIGASRVRSNDAELADPHG